MNPTEEELLHAFYGCDSAALDRLAERIDPLLSAVALEVLKVRAGSAMQALDEWDVDVRLDSL